MNDFTTVADVTKIDADTSSVTLIALNTHRRFGSVYNDSTATLYVNLDDTATTDDWWVKLNQDDYAELPDGYRGPVSGVWSAATGQARVAEGHT